MNGMETRSIELPPWRTRKQGSACQSCRAQHKKCRCSNPSSENSPAQSRRGFGRRDSRVTRPLLPNLGQYQNTVPVNSPGSGEIQSEVPDVPDVQCEDIDSPSRSAFRCDILNQSLDLPLDDINGHSSISIGATSIFGLGPAIDTVLFDDDTTGMDSTLQPFVVDCAPFPTPSPMSDTMIGSIAAFGPLPFRLTKMDQLALHTLATETLFSVGGTKHPTWSTHAVILARGKNNTGVLRLLLAASLSELWYRQSIPQVMQNAAEKHHESGKEVLAEMVHSSREPDHLFVVMSFWFLYLRQFRWDPTGEGFRNISRQLSDYYQTHGLDRLLASSPATATARNISSAAKLPAAFMTCLARLTSWLFWADAMACFYGDGGSFARYLIGLSPDALSAIYSRSKSTLTCHFGDAYPFDQVVDDNENELALELIHQTWVIVQQIHDALDMGAADGLVGKRLCERIEYLLCGGRYSDVLRDAKNRTMVRDRRLANADWAVSNLYALCIYFSRYAVEEQSLSTSQTLKGEQVVMELMEIMDRSIDGGQPGQADRLQWPLFWGAVETRDRIHQKWALQHLSSHRLAAGARAVLQEQAITNQRMGIVRIREICTQGSGEGLIFQMATG